MPAELASVRVFVSSTSEDLKPYRGVARDAILRMGWIPIMMEDFGAMPESTVPACVDKLRTCQVVLLIQAFRCGWVPTSEEDSMRRFVLITAMMFAAACGGNKPPATSAATSSSTVKSDKDTKTDESAKDKDKDDKDDEGPAKKAPDAK